MIVGQLAFGQRKAFLSNMTELLIATVGDWSHRAQRSSAGDPTTSASISFGCVRVRVCVCSCAWPLHLSLHFADEQKGHPGHQMGNQSDRVPYCSTLSPLPSFLFSLSLFFSFITPTFLFLSDHWPPLSVASTITV